MVVAVVWVGSIMDGMSMGECCYVRPGEFTAGQADDRARETLRVSVKPPDGMLQWVSESGSQGETGETCEKGERMVYLHVTSVFWFFRTL